MAKKKELTSEYLKRVYGLDLNDMDLTENDSIEEVDRQCEKYDIEKLEDMDPMIGIRAMSSFATITGNAKDGWLIQPRR